MEDNSNQNSNPNFLNEDLFNEIKEKLNNPLLIEILKALGISTTTLLANYYFFSKPTNERIDYLEKKVSKKNKSLKKQSVQIEQLKSSLKELNQEIELIKNILKNKSSNNIKLYNDSENIFESLK